MKYLKLYPTKLNTGLQKTTTVEICPVTQYLAEVQISVAERLSRRKNISPYSGLARNSNKSQFTLLGNTNHFFLGVDILF